MFQSTKEFTGFSACFRQWGADSHCRFLHGYALRFKVWFERRTGGLNELNWVQDFGDLKEAKEALAQYFDHKTLIAADDPQLEAFERLDALKVIDLKVLNDGVGAEKFAELAYLIVDNAVKHPVYVKRVECFEGTHNSAIYEPDEP